MLVADESLLFQAGEAMPPRSTGVGQAEQRLPSLGAWFASKPVRWHDMKETIVVSDDP